MQRFCISPSGNENRLFFLGAAVLFFAVLAAVDLFFFVCQEENVIQFLLNGSDASGIFTVDDIHKLFRELQVFFCYDPAVLDNVHGDAVVNKAQHIQIQLVDRAFYFNDIFLSHLIAVGIFNDGYTAVHAVKL